MDLQRLQRFRLPRTCRRRRPAPEAPGLRKAPSAPDLAEDLDGRGRHSDRRRRSHVEAFAEEDVEEGEARGDESEGEDSDAGELTWGRPHRRRRKACRGLGAPAVEGEEDAPPPAPAPTLPPPATSSNEAEHLSYQETVFDKHASLFASDKATPPEVLPRLRRVAELCQLSERTSVLDVATGTGVLLPFFFEQGVPLDAVTGVDLSEGMLSYARARFPGTNFVKADFSKFQDPDGGRFDRVVFNACFGNFWDPALVLRRTSELLLEEGGLVVVSHPLGRRWLEGLRIRDPLMVRHLLPSSAEELQALAARAAPELAVVAFHDEDDFYCAILQRRTV